MALSVFWASDLGRIGWRLSGVWSRFFTDNEAYFASLWKSRNLFVQVAEETNVFVNVRDKSRVGSTAFFEDGRHTEPNALKWIWNEATICVGDCLLFNEPLPSLFRRVSQFEKFGLRAGDLAQFSDGCI